MHHLCTAPNCRPVSISAYKTSIIQKSGGSVSAKKLGTESIEGLTNTLIQMTWGMLLASRGGVLSGGVGMDYLATLFGNEI